VGHVVRRKKKPVKIFTQDVKADIYTADFWQIIAIVIPAKNFVMRNFTTILNTFPYSHNNHRGEL
jgi:hypothetical protein